MSTFNITHRSFDPIYYNSEDDFHMPTAWDVNFIWKDRDDYFEWVANWKAVLHKQVELIRFERSIRQDKSRSISERCEAQTRRQIYRGMCRDLMTLRKAAKVRSWAQRQQQNRANA